MPLPANQAISPDEYIDYYELLDQPEDATIAELRGRINDLYSEAQQNRDHRNAQKRREYQLWLDLLPGARALLTEEDKRAQYDEYRQRVKSGGAVPSFKEFLGVVEGKPEKSTEDTSVLGLRQEAKPVPATVAKPAPPPPAPSSTGAIAALGCLVVVAGIAYAATKNAGIALVAGAVVAAVIFFAMKGKQPVAR